MPSLKETLLVFTDLDGYAAGFSHSRLAACRFLAEEITG